MTLALLGQSAGLVLVMMTALWALSVYLRDVSIVDPWWSIAFLIVTLSAASHSALTTRKLLLVTMVGVWSVRLWLHLLLRSRGRPEDPRYAEFRRRFGPERYWWLSFFQVFLLQGALAFVISAPLQMVAAEREARGLGVVECAAVLVFAAGFSIEAVADWQLQTFRSRPVAGAEVLATGLWRYSRHPNYFGEALLWWGFWLLAAGSRYGWATAPAPMLMTFLLLRVSGVTILDAHLTATKPGYADYVRRTSAFVLRPPKR